MSDRNALPSDGSCRARRWRVRRSNAACTAAVPGHPALLAERDFSCAGRSVRCRAAASVFAADRCRRLCQRSPQRFRPCPAGVLTPPYPDGRERGFREPDFRRRCRVPVVSQGTPRTSTTTMHFVLLPRLVSTTRQPLFSREQNSHPKTIRSLYLLAFQLAQKRPPDLQPNALRLPIPQPSPAGRRMQILLRPVLPSCAALQNPENPFQHPTVLDPRAAALAIFARFTG